MMRFKPPFQGRNLSAMNNKETHYSARKDIYKNIHKCPVNTLLTSIFSGIAWNG